MDRTESGQAADMNANVHVDAQHYVPFESCCAGAACDVAEDSVSYCPAAICTCHLSVSAHILLGDRMSRCAGAIEQ